MLQERLPDTWAPRDYPVLLETARVLDAGGRRVQVRDLLGRTGMERRTVINALDALVPTYLVGRPVYASGTTLDYVVTGLSERGRRIAGLWPSTDLIEDLVKVLQQAEEASANPGERELVAGAWRAVAAVPRDVILDALAGTFARYRYRR